MVVAIDWDGTFDLDIDAWEKVVRVLLSAGHSVVIVSARGAHRSPNVVDYAEVAFGGEVEVLYARTRSKLAETRAAGIEVDVWIEDRPWYVNELPDTDR